MEWAIKCKTTESSQDQLAFKEHCKPLCITSFSVLVVIVGYWNFMLNKYNIDENLFSAVLEVQH